MKNLLIFRGENERTAHGYMSALDCVENWKTIFNSIEYDVAFLTYESPILKELCEKMCPKFLIVKPKMTQMDNIKDVANFISDKNYERYIISRFDLFFRMPINEWPKINETGIFLTNKDVHWPTKKYYADCLFIVDDKFKAEFIEGCFQFSDISLPHTIGQNLYHKNKKIILMYEGYYGTYGKYKHPLYGIIPLSSLEDEITEILDVSEWN